MSFHCSWLSLFLRCCLLPFVVSKEKCPVREVYVTGPANAAGRYRVHTPGSSSGTAHGDRPIYIRVDDMSTKTYLYFSERWTFATSTDGNGELYFCSSDADCPDSTTDWYDSAYGHVSLRITEASSEGKCPKNYPMCSDEGHCRTNTASSPYVFAPDAATLPSTTYNSIRGTKGGPAPGSEEIDRADLCMQDYEACPRNFPYCDTAEGNEGNCVIDDCASGFGYEKNKLEICHFKRTAYSPEEIPWRCSEPWRCSQTSPSGKYNMINGFDARDNKCKKDYKVRMCPEDFPLCHNGDCVLESCKDECEAHEKKKGTGAGQPCNQNYQEPYCPKSYPTCHDNDCHAKDRDHDAVGVKALRPGIIPTPQTRFNYIKGYDGDPTHHCKVNDRQAEDATCPFLYPLCIGGDCRTLEVYSRTMAVVAHPVWAMYPTSALDTCLQLNGVLCNSIHGYDGLGAKCDQNNGAPLRKDKDNGVCPPEYPYCATKGSVEFKDNCFVQECRDRSSEECRDLLGGERPRPAGNNEENKPNSPEGKFVYIVGFNNQRPQTRCRASYYEVRRCPPNYPVCHNGDCVVERCKPGVGDPCTWKVAEANPFKDNEIPEPISSTTKTAQYNRLRGYDGLGNTCNERFKAFCPKKFPICVKEGRYAGDCIIEYCKESPGLNSTDPKCQAKPAAKLPSDVPEVGKSFNRVEKDGKGDQYAMKCSLDYEAAMCPRKYPNCLMRGDHEGDCVKSSCKGDITECGTMREAPSFDTEPASSFDRIHGNDGWGSPCNEPFQEIDVYLYASEQDLLHWLTGMTAWHTSISVGDTEYWYDPEGGGSIKEAKFIERNGVSTPPLTSHIATTSGLIPKAKRGDQIDVYKVYLGHASKTGDSMKKELLDLFQLPDNGFDIVYRNSNTFSDFALWSLLGIRLSEDWNAENLNYERVKTVTGLLTEANLNVPKENGEMQFNFGAAESKVRKSQDGLYDQARELFALLGKNLGDKRWYDEYICRTAKDEVSRAWDDPSFRPRKGHLSLEMADLRSTARTGWMEHTLLPNNLANGGKNEKTKADKVVPADAKHFLKLLDLLIANCFSVLYKQQANLGNEWRSIETSEELNSISAIPPETKDVRDKEYWAWQNHLWDVAGESHDPEANPKIKTLNEQLGKTDRDTYDEVMQHLDDRTPAATDPHLHEHLQLVGTPKLKSNNRVDENTAAVERALDQYQVKLKFFNRIDVMEIILADNPKSGMALSNSIRKGLELTKANAMEFKDNLASVEIDAKVIDAIKKKIEEIDNVLSTVPKKLLAAANTKAMAKKLKKEPRPL